MLDEATLDLFGITAIKADKQELAALTGGLEPFEAMKFLHLNGIKFVIFTSSATIHMFYKQTHWIKVNGDNYNYADTNDILSVAFCCSYIKERSVMGYLFWDRLHAPSP